MLVVAIVILACAIALTFVVDWMKQTRRPEWLIEGAGYRVASTPGHHRLHFEAARIALVKI